MDNTTLKTLQTSHDRKELQKAALAMARASDASALQALGGLLCSAEFLERLDSADEYLSATGKRLRISRTIEALATNPAVGAVPVFTRLTRDQVFRAEDERTAVLIEQSRHIRPPPGELVTFWDDHCQPDDGFTPLTITALVENGSEPALRLFEKKMADPTHEDETKIAWMRTRVLAHRNDVSLLQSCGRMVYDTLPLHLRPYLVEVLFDYKGEWYRPASVINPPSRALLSAAGRIELRKVGETALQLSTVSEALKIKVKATLAGLDPVR